MTSSYFGGANAVIIVFDLTNQASLDAVEKWIKEAQSFADKSKPLAFLIVGNKKDLEVLLSNFYSLSLFLTLSISRKSERSTRTPHGKLRRSTMPSIVRLAPRPAPRSTRLSRSVSFQRLARFCSDQCDLDDCRALTKGCR